MCDILAAISYSYGYNERPRKRVKINMTIPSRPAPPPPQRNTTTPLRYTPTTDWDFCAFDSSSTSSQPAAGNGQCFPAQQSHNVKGKKPPPPRPPPPKLPAAPTAPLKKPNQPQSINILSSLFGHKRGANGGATASKPAGGGAISHPKHNFTSGPVKLLPPPSAKPAPGKVSNFATFTEHHSSSSSNSSSSTNYGSFVQSARSAGAGQTASSEMQLISFDSPPSSPTFTQKSCSDCISVDSFSSDSNYSSPNNGNMSQAESGFEDDFVACASNNRHHHQSGASLPWGDLDPFDGSHGTAAAPSPAIIYGTLPLASSATAQIRAPLINSKLQQSDFVDPLCNGQSVLPKVPIMSMPTIIKPPTSSNPESQKSTPAHSTGAHMRNMVGAPKISAPTMVVRGYAGMEDDFAPDTGAFDSLTSHPMPNVPPPPPPPALTDEPYAEEPYGIALYDFQGEADEDLSFKTNEKIYLLKRLNDEWYMGRDKRGLEGMFPVNYVEVKVPLASCASEEPPHGNVTNAVKVRALYSFKAEAPEDLTMMENDYVAVLYQITPDWLYGEIDDRRGQFPANFIEHVPPNLPQMPTASS